MVWFFFFLLVLLGGLLLSFGGLKKFLCQGIINKKDC